jgi:hypothetical protein
MTPTIATTERELVAELQESASLFREHPVYNSEGDGVLLTLNAELDERAATTIESLLADKARLVSAMAWLAQHKNAQLYWYGHIYADDDREPETWRVDLERGGINDREWETVGRGENPLEAILSAQAALNRSQNT